MMLAPSARVVVRWPSAVSLSDSSHGAGNRGSLSPSLPRVGALNIFRAAETGDVETMLTYLNGGGEPNKTGKVSAAAKCEVGRCPVGSLGLRTGSRGGGSAAAVDSSCGCCVYTLSKHDGEEEYRRSSRTPARTFSVPGTAVSQQYRAALSMIISWASERVRTFQ